MNELRKQFKIDKPETVGETDKAFDDGNYIDWLEEKYNAQKMYNDCIVEACNKFLDSLETRDLNPQRHLKGIRILLNRPMPKKYGE